MKLHFSTAKRLVLVTLVAVTSSPLGVDGGTALDGNRNSKPRALSVAHSILSLDSLEKKYMDPIDLAQVQQEDEQRSKQFLAPRFAIPQKVRIIPEKDGTWEVLDDGSYMWRFVFEARGHCLSLNFGFHKFHLEPGMELYIYDPESEDAIGPLTYEDNNIHNEKWTQIIYSCRVVLELDVDSAASPWDAILEVGTVGVGYVDLKAQQSDRHLSGSCNRDVACPEANGWRNEIQAVGLYSFSGSLRCTGFLVNNVKQDKKPYFMTANHCNLTPNNAASVVVYWNYETSTCGGTPNGNLNAATQSGATLLIANPATDFTMLLLDNQPNLAWQISYAGWDVSGTEATTAVAIHHPNLDEKRISFEYQGTKTTSYYGTSTPGDGNHLMVADWDSGTTEPGSSGSPLFNQVHRVIGQLHGGDAACNNNEPDWYGKLAKSWSTLPNLRKYLDPDSTGVTAVDTLPYNGGSTPLSSPTPSPTKSPSTTEGTCGNGIAESPEQCDGTSLSGSCSSQGFPEGGSLSCASDCTLNTSGCRKIVYALSGISQDTDEVSTCSISLDYATSLVQFRLSGSSGDGDLYVRYGLPPTFDDYDCSPYENGSNEECTHHDGAGTYYFMVHAYGGPFSNLQLKVITDGNPPSQTPVVDCNGSGPPQGPQVVYERLGMSQNQDEKSTCSINLDFASTGPITFTLGGGTGDADLYVRKGRAPTLNKYNCRSWETGNDELCILNSGPEVYYFMVDAYYDFDGVDLQVLAEGNTPSTLTAACSST